MGWTWVRFVRLLLNGPAGTPAPTMDKMQELKTIGKP